MSFHDLINRANAASIRAFVNCEVLVNLTGVTANTLPGIFNEASEVVTPYEAEALAIKPSVTVLTSDMQFITSSNDLVVNEKTYRMDGKPRPSGTGFTTIYLGHKK